jgi:flagellar motor switch protein FliN
MTAGRSTATRHVPPRIWRPSTTFRCRSRRCSAAPPLEVSQLLKLGRGAVVELDRRVGEAVDIYVNNRLVARGEVVVVEDRLGVTMTEIVKGERG